MTAIELIHIWRAVRWLRVEWGAHSNGAGWGCLLTLCALRVLRECVEFAIIPPPELCPVFKRIEIKPWKPHL